jgi:hypothetical protein
MPAVGELVDPGAYVAQLSAGTGLEGVGAWTGFWLFGARPGEELQAGRQGCVEPFTRSEATNDTSANGCGETAALYGTAVGCATERALRLPPTVADDTRALGALYEELVARGARDLVAVVPGLDCGPAAVSPTAVRPDEVVGAEPATACGRLVALATEAGFAAPAIPGDLRSVGTALDSGVKETIAALSADPAAQETLQQAYVALARRATAALVRAGDIGGTCAGLPWCAFDSAQRTGLAQVRVTRSNDPVYDGLPNADILCVRLTWAEDSVRPASGRDAYRTRCAAVPQLPRGGSVVLTFALLPDTTAAEVAAREREIASRAADPMLTPVRRCELTGEPEACRRARRVALELWWDEVFRRGGTLGLDLSAWVRAAGDAPTRVAPILGRTTLIDASQAFSAL